jgi:uncharacterized membrane protein
MLKKWFNFKSYQWKNQMLRKKYNQYMLLTVICMAVTLICLYVLPSNMKALNIVIILIAAYFWYKGYQVQKVDKSLRLKKLENENDVSGQN